jgi:hypothetical protein
MDVLLFGDKNQSKYFKERDNIGDTIRSWKGNHDKYDSFLPNHVLVNLPLEKRKKAAFMRVASIVDV